MMSAVKATDVKRGIAVIWENLQCPICLDLMSQPVSTRCDHQFCKFCMTRLLERNKRKETSCPVCKAKVTKRSLQESPGFQKLVEGLQNLVRSYEFDTSTNYFTGLPQRRQGTSVETESRDQHCSGENTPTEGDVTEKEATLSSTAEAKDAFAKLMCLEDSRPDTAEEDCLDGSHGDSAQKSEIKPADPGDVPLTPGACNSQTQQDVTPDDGKRSCRRSKRLCLEPDRIVDKRQKKSVQKVSEWLLKISPTSDAAAESYTEGALLISTESDGDRESTASRASTEIHASGNDKADASPERAVPCRGLEEQVFGAVYKRERRVSKVSKFIKSYSSEKEIAPVGNVTEKDETIETPKRRSSRKVAPVETASKDKDDGACEGNGSLRFSDEPEQEVQNGLNESAENKEESPAFEVPVKKPGRRSKKMQAVWQDVDRDLAEKESNKKDRTRRSTRSSSDAAKEDESEKSKNGKYAKSLALVSAGTEIIDMREKVPGNPKLIETEVSIESYPSSAELKSPDARRTRRSLRLQEFTAEVQGLTRRSRSKQAVPKPTEVPEKDPTTSLDETREKTGRAGTSQSEANPSEKPDQSVRRRNGCVYNDDSENIEVVQLSEDAAAPKCVSEGTETEEHSLVSVVPDTVNQDKHILTSPTSSSTKVENSTSPLAAVVPESLPQKRQEGASTETFMCGFEDRETEQDEDTNDSELDTEQLMKTFKVTKRKSFYLGSPRTSHSRSKEKSLTQIVEEDKQECVDQPEMPYISPDYNQGLPLNACKIPSQTSQSCVADAASVSLLQVKSPAHPSLPKDSSIKTSGAHDHYEKVAESQDCSRSQVSRPPVNIELGNSIQLFSTSVTQEEPPISCSKDSIKSQKSSEILEEPSQANSDEDRNKIPSIPLGNTADSEIRCNNFESSVTPDGLVPHGPEALTTEPAATQNLDKVDGEEELSQPRVCRKRKAQRLESSGSESSVDNEDLPPLAQIFKSHQWPSAPDKEPVKTSSKQDGVHAEDRDSRPGSEPVSQDSRSRSEPEAQSTPASQRITSYQKGKSAADVNPEDVEDGDVPDPACGDQWISDSQGSVDLFGTPREGEAVAEGVCTNTGLSIEASQYSSEILSTQQKQEMQQELHRLERMMALVSEALQKKDDDLEDKKDQTADEDQHSGHRGRTRSQRSCKSLKQPSQRSEVTGQLAVPEVLAVGVTEERKPDESRGDAFGEPAMKNECRAVSGDGMELVVSGLSATEQGLVKKFARKMKAGVSSQVTPSTTHIIIKTDGNLVCERTLKYFQGIAGRKWVVSFLWISECFKHGKLLAEAPYEVCGDVVNGLDHSGPRKARTAPDDDLLMRRCEICFQGSFTDMSTDQMELMVEQCGATVVKDPLMFSRKGLRYQLVVVQPGPDDSQSYYTALQRKATVVTRSWLLDSVATYTLQNPQDYKP
ncbi:breast cancer type 1 susceptibility protein homolog [Clarias gariepinus]|uniref:breast cancer type 1 susceptibility protein homolog n=1 Tax=Clarias gariepinus TaxID=13013 RepID=UPI00234D5A5E|nr:breast cancer type 1 susceptibility protein homolog [Clarias gariepinus]XP_053346960.1 breast cancer type 1 susceptibility protein homolog [Clarias gariepinus]